MPKQAILCVDDEAIIVIAMKQELKGHFGHAYYIDTALSAQEAFNKIDEMVENGIELVAIISDWLMPGMKGDEFLTKIHAIYPDIKLVMLTGHASESEMADLAREVSLEAFIRKPWNAEQLVSGIDKALAADAGPSM